MNETKTAVATHADGGTAAVPAPKPAIQTGGKLAALVPQSFDEMFRIANALSQAGDMVPKHFQGRPNEIMAAMMRGQEVGLATMQALASIAVINGRASIWGDAIPGLLMRSGHFIDYVVEGEGQTLKATATLTRKDGRTIVRTFSMDDAKRAGLAGKAGPWQQYPQRMVAMRARAWAARDGASDVLMGLEIAEEVLDHIGPENAKDVTPKPKPGRAVYVEDTPARDEPPHDEDGVIHETSDAEIVESDEQRAARELHETADAKAGEGVAAFREWWTTLPSEARSEVAKRSVAYKEKAERADAAKAPTDDPFADGDADTGAEGAGRTVNFDTIIGLIKREIIAGNVPDDIRGMYEEELTAMKEQRPELYAEAEKALAGEAA